MKTREMYLSTEFTVRKDEGNDKYLEGYFIKYNEETTLSRDIYEEIIPQAVINSLLKNDIRCLFNHNTEIVLGRTGNQTLELTSDSVGLFGRVKINPNDKQAMDILARIERGDINACSFGFNIIDEEIQDRSDGSIKFILREIDLKEVSPVTFPAYPTTSISARTSDCENHKSRIIEQRKNKLKGRITNGYKTVDDPETN